jgi:extradiol dioxygenase family protein
MSNTFFGVAVDCTDAATLAQFWADVLGREVAETAKNRLHLDLIAG